MVFVKAHLPSGENPYTLAYPPGAGKVAQLLARLRVPQPEEGAVRVSREYPFAVRR